MPRKKKTGKRVTVLFNLQDWEAIQMRCSELEAERGYPVSVSDALRELVQENWTPASE